MNDGKYELAAKMSAKMVVEELADRHGWSLNDALSNLTKTSLYERILDTSTSLWKDNPRDIADIVEYELRGEEAPIELFFL
jgi:hypothetical protein